MRSTYTDKHLNEPAGRQQQTNTISTKKRQDSTECWRYRYFNYNLNNQQRDSYRRNYNQQSESERDTLFLRNYMYYKNRYQLQNGKVDGHWGSYYADHYLNERGAVSLNGYSGV